MMNSLEILTQEKEKSKGSQQTWIKEFVRYRITRVK